MKSLFMFATDNDRADLEAAMASFGVVEVLPPSLHMAIDMPLIENANKIISFIPRDEIIMKGDPPLLFDDIQSPLLEYKMPFLHEGVLCGGRIDDSEYSKTIGVTKPFMRKIKKWLRENWHARGNFYLSPEAFELEKEGALLVSVLGGHPINRPWEWEYPDQK